MKEFRELAAKIDLQMQQLSAEGVSDTHAIINRMMGHVPALHRIWGCKPEPPKIPQLHLILVCVG